MRLIFRSEPTSVAAPPRAEISRLRESGQLIKRVMKINPNLKTKRDAVNFALLDYVQSHESESLLDLMGKDLIDPAYDHKPTR